MGAFGAIGFAAPWLLASLAALPVLWFILRAVPPAPLFRQFPGVALLLGLTDRETQAERTPWWLLLLRMAALAAAITGFAGPVLNPAQVAAGGGPLLVLFDASWAQAGHWARAQDRAARALDEARAAGRAAAVLALTDLPGGRLVFAPAGAVAEALPGLVPRGWEPGEADWGAVLPAGGFETLWLSDGLARPMRAGLLAAVEARGAVRVVQPAGAVLALGAALLLDGALRVPVLAGGTADAVEVVAFGPDPAGIERDLARVTAAPGTEAVFDLPPELRNRITRFEIAGLRSAGAVALTDDSLKRRKVALIAGSSAREGLELLAPTHYLRQALEPSAEILEGTPEDMLLAAPDVVILADVAQVAEPEKLADWVARGGLLIRFAGPRLAAGLTGAADPLLPVRLRAGGREVGGTMSWGAPRTLAPFAPDGPFAGLAVPDDVSVRAQVLAEPAPDLAEHTIAALDDGTPLITRAALGEGWVVLFHVSANAEWSSLPLSGLFVQMLERLAVSTRPAVEAGADLAGTTWVAERVLDGFGVQHAAGAVAGVAGEVLAARVPGPALPPGLYAAGERRVALNAVAPGRLLAVADWPAGVTVESGTEAPQALPLKGALLAAALALLLADVIGSLAVSGRLRGARGVAGVLALLLLVPNAPPAHAEMDPARATEVAGGVVLAYVPSGDAGVDRIAAAGLLGLSQVLYARTSVEPGPPLAVDLETDDLALFTFLYWPVTAEAQAPSPAAYARINRYLRGGGMILFDTRDADFAGFGAATPEGRRLQALAAPLDIPPLEPIPRDHVLTRTFYLLQDFPGRFGGQAIWVEAAPPDAELAEGMPFRNLNDGVTPVVIGGNDWAAAWAVDGMGVPLLPVGRGQTGERQREIAYRFGVNLIMHVLTGNYKSDQVHVPALLERLGQ
ncbi:MAG: LytTR family transcriptional regulator [Alphaproteobacteria bacterium HGW-Alphaproteobacteria-4]|nr:MAG: LytTR family transcriptional regulator [Alphaproteobacteria bacterium HGW-Alphaproteobacteria-4]